MSEGIGVVTDVGAEKIAVALDGGIGLSELKSDVGIGNGGHDPNTGEVLEPDRGAIETPGEFMTKEAVSFSRTGAKYEVEVLLDHTDGAASGEMVSSLGIYDTDNDLFLIINFAARPKDEYNTITMSWEINF